MKITIDTTNKTIKVEENVKLIDLIEVIKELCPETWEEFTLESAYQYPYPWIIPATNPVYPVDRPFYDPYKVTCNMNTKE